MREERVDAPGSLRVLHALAPAPWGGLETVVRLLAAEQQRAGAEVVVAAVVGEAGGAHPFVERAMDEGIRVEPIVAPGRRYRTERSAVRELIRRHGPDVVHTHGYRSDVVGAPVARQLGVPTVSTVHGFTGNGLRNRFYEWLQRRALRSFDAVVAVAAAQVATLEDAGVPASSIHLIPNAWRGEGQILDRMEARNRLGLPSETRSLVGYVGRLSPEKGPDILVRVMTHEVVADAELCLVGEGNAEAELRAMVRDLHLGDRVHWAGAVGNAATYMSAFDVLAVPSRTEGTPMVLFESAAARVPVVATAVGEIPNVLGDGRNVVPPGDEGLFARALARILYDGRSRDEALHRAQKRIEQSYTVEGWIRQYCRLYRGVARDHRQGGASPVVRKRRRI